MAAVLADGESILENAAREPEITDLIIMLRKMALASPVTAPLPCAFGREGTPRH